MTRATLTLVAVAVLAAVAWWLVDDEAPRDDVAVVEPREVATSTPGATPDDAAADALDETPRELAPTDETAATEPARDAVRIAGRVVTEFGAPIPDAELLLVPDGATLVRDAPDFHAMSSSSRLVVPPDTNAAPWTSFHRAQSDALGRFALDVTDLEPAWLAGTLGITEDLPLLVVRAEGFATRRASIAARDVDGELVVTLVPGARIAGRVTWSDGTSAVGLEVEATPPFEVAFDVTRRGFVRPWRTTRTDAEGRYALDGLPAAVLDVAVHLGAAASAAAEVDTNASSTVVHDVVLAPGPRLELTVTSDGRPVADAEVYAWPADPVRRHGASRRAMLDLLPLLRAVYDRRPPPPFGAARTDAGGFALLEFPSGTLECSLIVSSPGHQFGHESRMTLDGDVTRHALDLAPRTRDLVEVIDTSTGAHADVELTFRRVDAAMETRRLGIGRFELAGRGNESVRAVVSAPDVADLEVEIAGDARHHTIEWASVPPAVVRGRTVDEDGVPLTDAGVVLTAVETDVRRRRETTSDDRGRFELAARPGPHALSAIADHHDVTRLDLDLAAGTLDLGDVVLASVGRLVVVDHERGPPRSISIARGVGVDDDEEWQGFWSMMLTAQGRGVVERVAAGRYRIERRGYPTKVVEVVADETTTVEYATEEPVRLVATLAAPTDEAFTLEARVPDAQIGSGRQLLAPTPFTDRLDVTVPYAPQVELRLRDAAGVLVLTETLDDVVPGSVQSTVLEPGSGTLTLALDASTANCVVTPVLDGTPRGNFRADRAAGTRVSLGYVPVGVIDVEVHACGVVEALTIDTTRVSTLTVRRLDGLPIAIEVVAE